MWAALEMALMTMLVVFLVLAGLSGVLFLLQRVGGEPDPEDFM